MKRGFVILLLLLTAASAYSYFSLAEQRSERPVLQWSSDTNPERYRQVDLFRAWLLRAGHVDAQGEPAAQLTLSAGGNQTNLIQAVSGMGSDVMDAQVAEFAPMGVARPLDDYAAGADFHYSRTYPGAQALLRHDGRQYGYPANLAVSGFIFNLDALASAGLEAPPASWTTEEYERVGRLFVERANAGRARREFFFGPAVNNETGQALLVVMARAQGADVFNETLTAARCADPRFVEALARLHRWTYRDRLFPTAAEEASVAAEAGFGGVSSSQFADGRYASVWGGRYVVIRFREFARPIRMASAPPPMDGFPNLILFARTVILYAGSRHPDAARLFFDFLAGREYNDRVIAGADGLPPNPAFALDNPAYLAPPEYPNEGNLHANELAWALTVALPAPASPYYKTTGQTLLVNAIELHFNGLATAEEAMADAQRRYRHGIAAALRGNERLRREWEEECRRQEAIDRLNEEGRPLPAAWIRNPYYLAYYRAAGRLAEEAAGEAQP